jgi:hypothetical protein
LAPRTDACMCRTVNETRRWRSMQVHDTNLTISFHKGTNHSVLSATRAALIIAEVHNRRRNRVRIKADACSSYGCPLRSHQPRHSPSSEEALCKTTNGACWSEEDEARHRQKYDDGSVPHQIDHTERAASSQDTTPFRSIRTSAATSEASQSIRLLGACMPSGSSSDAWPPCGSLWAARRLRRDTSAPALSLSPSGHPSATLRTFSAGQGPGEPALGTDAD